MGGRKKGKARVCGAKMTEIRDGDTTSKGAATAARSEGESCSRKTASSESGQKGEGTQPRLHWELGWVNDG